MVAQRGTPRGSAHPPKRCELHGRASVWGGLSERPPAPRLLSSSWGFSEGDVNCPDRAGHRRICTCLTVACRHERASEGRGAALRGHPALGRASGARQAPPPTALQTGGLSCRLRLLGAGAEPVRLGLTAGARSCCFDERTSLGTRPPRGSKSRANYRWQRGLGGPAPTAGPRSKAKRTAGRVPHGTGRW